MKFEIATFEVSETLSATSEEVIIGTELLVIGKSPRAAQLNEPWSARTSWANFRFDVSPVIHPRRQFLDAYFVFWITPNSVLPNGNSLNVDGDWPVQVPNKSGKQDNLRELPSIMVPGALEVVEVYAPDALSPIRVTAKADHFRFGLLYNVFSDKQRLLRFLNEGNQERSSVPVHIQPWDGGIKLSVSVNPNSPSVFNIYSQSAEPKYRPQFKIIFKKLTP